MKAISIKPGDKIALVTPAGPINTAKLSNAVQIVESLGLKPVWGDKVHKHYGYLAGTDQERLEELIEAYQNPAIKGVFAIRGGYGTLRLLDKIQYEIIEENPKILLGFSDITALQIAIYKKVKLPSLHTNLSSLAHQYTQEIFKKIVFEKKRVTLDFHTDFTPQPSTIVAGEAKGILIGGNLTLLTSLIGTKFLPRFKGKIVFLEEINEPPYKIDRMLTQLFLATDIEQAAGIILGIFNKCNRENFYKKPQDSLTLKDVFLDKFSNFNGPVIGGFPLGHINKMAILPIGTRVYLNTEKAQLRQISKIFD